MRDRPLQLMLVDEDPRFRLGLRVWLEQQGDFQVVEEAGKAEEALRAIRSRFQQYEQARAEWAVAAKKSQKPRRGWQKNKRNQPEKEPPAVPLDLVLLDLGMGANGSDNRPGLQLCQQITAEFLSLPVLVLSAESEPELEAAAEQAGASGYGTRSMSVRRLAQLISQAAAKPYATPTVQQGKTPEASPPVSIGPPASPLNPTAVAPANVPSAEPSGKPSSRSVPQASPTISPPDSKPISKPEPAAPPSQSRRKSSALSRLDDIPGPLTAMRISMRLSGLQQIDQNIAAVEASKQQTTSWLNQAILDGKKRELTAARWLVASIWRTPEFSDKAGDQRNLARGRAASARTGRIGNPSTDWIRIAQQGGYGANYADMTAARYLERDSLVPNATAALAATTARLQARPSEVQNVVFERVFAKLQGPLKNNTQSPLEIDILRADKKLELLYLVLRQLEELLADLRLSNVQAGQLDARAAQVLKDLWDDANTDFFGKYYTVRISNVEEEVVTLLQQEKPIVEAQILNKIPMASDLFGHWLFQEPMEIEGKVFDAASPQAIARSEQLLENLLIQVANAIMQPLLNRLSDTESIKKSLYTSRLMSTREIERFRNDLSWRYRKDRIVDEPQAIFESRYNLFVLGARGLEKTSIYAPRRAELDRLRGLPLMVTLALETRDAIAPRLRTAFSFVGSSVVYVLTEVLGRGIGLVGRGVLKGVGNIRQDGKARQSKRQPDYSESSYRDDFTQEDDYSSSSTDRNDAYVESPYSQEFNEWE